MKGVCVCVSRTMVRSILLSLSLVLMLFSIQFGHAQDDGK